MACLRLIQMYSLGLAIGFTCFAAGLDADEPTRENAVRADVVYGHKDGLALTLDVHKPSGNANRGAVLFMVSGGWYSVWAPPEATRPLISPFLDHGFAVFAVRHGSSPRYTIPEAVADVREAVRFVRGHAADFDIDAERLGVFGMSAGGHLALMLGTTGDDGHTAKKGTAESEIPSRVSAVVAFVPPTDLRVAVWESPESLPAYRGFPALNLAMDKAEENSPLVHVTPDDAPALVVMGEKDELVPPRHGTWIEEAFQAKKVPSKLLIVRDAGHDLGGAAHRSQMYDEAVQWFNKHLLDKK
jgi:acetyl esterase/lipase